MSALKSTSARPATGWVMIVVMVAASAAGCVKDRTGEAPAPGIVTSFNALRLIVQPLAGDIPVSSLLPEGVSPHAYAPRPSETVRLHRASLVVHAHPVIDGWIAEMTSAAHVAMFEEVWEVPSGHGPESHPDDVHTDGDPHFWTDPVAVSRTLPALADGMCAVFPEDCAPIRRRAAVFAGSLRAAQDSLAGIASTWQALHPDACFITAQPFVDHFLERFGFSFVGPISPSPDVEASPTSLSRLLSGASDRGCNTLIVQDALENRMEKRLAAERGWALVSVDPLGSSASSYTAYLGRLMSALTEAPAAAGAASTSP